MDEKLNVVLGNMYDPYSGDTSTVWKSRDGRTTEISDMVDAHLVNSINYIKRRYNPDFVSPEGDKMSTLSVDFIESAGSQLAKRFADCLSHVRSMVDSPRYKHLWKEALKRGLVDEHN